MKEKESKFTRQKIINESVGKRTKKISEHKYVKEALRRAEHIQSIILDTMSELVVYQDMDNRIMWANRAAAESVNLPVEKLAGKYCYQIWHQRNKPCADCPVMEARETGKPQEGQITSPDGRIWFIRSYPVKNVKGKVVAIIEVTLEITDRKLAEIKMWEKTEDLTLITSLNNAANQGKNVNEIIDLLHKETARLFSCEGVTVYSISEDKKYLLLRKHLISPKVINLVEKIIPTRIPEVEIRIPLKAGSLYEKIIKEGKPRLINDPEMIKSLMTEFTENKILKKLIPKIYQVLGIQSVIIVPIISQGEPIGMLDISRKQPFTESDLYRIRHIAENLTNILSRKQTDEVLLESKKQYQNLYENIPSMNFTVDRKGKMVSVNRFGAEQLGYKTKELIGQPVLNVFSKEDKPIVPEQLEKCFQNPGQVFRWELRKIHKNGTIFWVRELAYSIKDHYGNPIVVISCQDITEHKRAEEVMRKYEFMVNTSKEFMTMLDKNYVYLTANDAYCKAHNKKREEIIGRTVKDIWGEEVFNKIIKKYLDKCFTGEEVTYQEWFEFPALGNRYFEVTYYPYLSNDGVVIYAVVITRDITERQRAEEELVKVSNEWQTTFDSTNDLIMLLDSEHKIIRVNLATLKFLQKPLEEVIGKTCYQLFHQTNILLEICPLERMKKTKKYEEMELFLPEKKIWIWTSVSPILDAQGNLTEIVHIIRDITERKKLEEQLLQAQRMESIGRLAGGIAHDFNNMLTAILGYSSLLLTTFPEDDPARIDVGEIKKAAERAATLTRQLLAFSRKQVLQPQVLNLNNLVKEMEKMIQRMIGEDVQLVTNLAPKLANVQADPGQIEQVIMNLMVNARDALPQGGKLALKTENVTIDEEYCKFNPEAEMGEYVCLSVEDSGVGMDKETLSHLFEPFFTTKEMGKGTGLGLSTVYGIIKQHKGWVNVYSELGKGTIFRIYLPVFMLEEEEKKERVPLSDELKGNGERILLVEDEEGVRNFTERVLSKNGYSVFTVESVKEALDIFRKEKGNFALVFSDVILGDRSGLELVEELLPLKPKLKIIFTSGYIDDKIQLKIVQEKGFKFIQKPYQITDLLRIIKEVIRAAK